MYGTAIHVDIGYCLADPSAGFAFQPPRSVVSTRSRPLGPRAVQNCPAVNQIERQLIEIPSPIALRLRLEGQGQNLQMRVDPTGTFAKGDVLRRMLRLEPPPRWRQPDRPVVRLSIPFFFVTDEPCMASMMPPFMHEGMRRWPGVGIGGRWPVTIWPQTIDWALEWDMPQGELVLRQGEPLAYVMFEFDDPNKRPRLVEADLTPELSEYRAGMDGVHHITDDIEGLWQAAAERRPERLLSPLETAAPAP
ncbi:MAG: hypothetical protein AAFS07_17515 [Pseudomonadota bacterium]